MKGKKNKGEGKGAWRENFGSVGRLWSVQDAEKKILTKVFLL